MPPTLDTILDAPAGQMSLDDLLAVIEAEEEDEPRNGTCPYEQQCEARRAALGHRPGHPCHWVAFWDVANCPIFRNGGMK